MSGPMHGPVERLEDLFFEYPDCSRCELSDGMNTDGSAWWCQTCGGSWDRYGYGGTREPQ